MKTEKTILKLILGMLLVALLSCCRDEELSFPETSKDLRFRMEYRQSINAMNDRLSVIRDTQTGRAYLTFEHSAYVSICQLAEGPAAKP